MPAGRPRVHGHGTEARARKHYRDGEKPCPACLEAAAFAARWREQQRKHAQMVTATQAALDAAWTSLAAEGWRLPA